MQRRQRPYSGSHIALDTYLWWQSPPQNCSQARTQNQNQPAEGTEPVKNYKLEIS